MYTCQRGWLIFLITWFSFAGHALAAEPAGTSSRLKALSEALTNDDPAVRDAAKRDLINREFRDLPAAQVVPLVLPLLKPPEADISQMSTQGLLMEYLAAVHGSKARAALPLLIEYFRDPKVTPYLRGAAISSAAKIAPDDSQLVGALISAIKHPEPRTTSGVHDFAARALGDMGKAALPASSAIRELLEHHFSIVRQEAFVALGKLSLVDHPVDTDQTIERLRSRNALTPDELSAALMIIKKQYGEQRKAAMDAAEESRRAARIAVWRPDDKRAAERAKTAARLAAEANNSQANDPTLVEVRGLLVDVIDEHDNNYSQWCAITTLSAIGPPSDRRTVEVLLHAFLKEGSSEAQVSLSQLDGDNSQCVEPLVTSLGETVKQEDWYASVVLAKTLARFGDAAASAQPHLSQGIRNVRKVTAPHDGYQEQIDTYLSTLIAIDARSQAWETVLELLDPQSPLAIASGDMAIYPKMCALRAYSGLGLPRSGPDRETALKRLLSALSSNHGQIRLTAAQSVAAVSAKMTDQEGEQFIQILLTLLDDERQQSSGTDQRDSQSTVSSKLAAINALANFGATAHDALPLLEKVAKQPIPTPSFIPTVSQRSDLIQAARKAVKSINGSDDN